MGFLRVALLACVLAAPLFVSESAGQSRPHEHAPRVTGTIAIQNARIVQSPGRIIERGTVLVRDGLIEAVGRDVRIPFDAERLVGDSLVVYAGFIDGLSHAGIERPQGDVNAERVDRPGAPPADRAGIQPQRRAADMVSPGDNSVEQLRAAGFTAAHVVPYGQSLPGSGAIVSLGGSDRGAMIIEPHVSLFAQFQSARGVYPSTHMATLASIRQMYREAQRRLRAETVYAENPEGLARPKRDEVHSAFFPVIRDERPIVFFTEGEADALQVHRILALQQSLGFPLILAGVHQAYEVVEVLRGGGHPILLSLGFPEAPDEPTDVAGEDTTRAITPEAPSTHFISDHRTITYADIDAERENLAARQAVERERYYARAADLHEAGISFGFTTKDVETDDIGPNLRRMIEHGLPEDVALAALTTNAATILGISNRMGSVDTGKIANLVITDGPLFDENTRIRYVIVDGVRHDVSDAAEDSDPDSASDPVGTWRHTIDAGASGTARGTLSIQRDGSGLRGTISADILPGLHSFETLEQDGRALRFSVVVDQVGRLEGQVNVRGDEMAGTLDVPGTRSAVISATRTSTSPRI